jgi:hypothetical protein
MVNQSDHLSRHAPSPAGKETIRTNRSRQRLKERGMLMTDLVVAMAILVMAILPLAYSFWRESRMLRASYCRGVAMEIVDGEMEILAAGEWRAFSDGQSPYIVQSGAVTNLPPGRFLFTKNANHLRLEWSSKERHGIGPVIREATVK